MAKISRMPGMFMCPYRNHDKPDHTCSKWTTSERALSLHIRFGHSIEINKMRDRLISIGYTSKLLNQMDEGKLAKEIRRAKERGILQ